jgi:hypothetical protein
MVSFGDATSDPVGPSWSGSRPVISGRVMEDHL